MWTQASLSVLLSAIVLYELRNYFTLDQSANREHIDFDDPKAEQTLKRALVIFRHGDRAPNDYQTIIQGGGDIACSNRTLWPDGCGELTKKGKQDAFRLGRRLRHRYGAILSDTYSKTNFKVTSTTMGRTIMSASLVSAGIFFPPKDHHVWHESILWHPVPVFPNRAGNSSNGFLCPSYAEELSKSLPRIEENILSNSELMNTLKEGGIEVDNRKTSLFFSFTLLYDSAFLADRNGVPLKPWQRKLLTNHKSTHDRMFFNFVVGNEKMRIINAGPQVKWIESEMSALPGRNFTMYSGHDLTLIAILSALGVTPLTVPRPSSCIALELHEVNGLHTVKVFYYEESRGSFKKLRIACEGENKACTYANFIQLIEKSFPRNYDEICRGMNDKEPIEIDRHVKLFVKGVQKQFSE